MPCSAVWRGSRRSMDTNRCHRASEYALQSRKMAIALPDELQEVTVSAMPPNQRQINAKPTPTQRQPLVTPQPAPHHGPSATRPASRRTILPNLNAKRVNTVIPASENNRGDVPEEDEGGCLSQSRTNRPQFPFLKQSFRSASKADFS